MFACLYAPPRGLVFRSAEGAPHQGGGGQVPERGARVARRDEGANWVFVTEARRRQAGCPARDLVTDQLVRLAREYSPRIEIHGDNLVVLDATGLTSMFGSVRELGTTLRRSAADQGLYLRIAVASTRTAALLVVQERSGLTVIESGREAVTLASLSLDVLKALAQAQGTATRARRGTRVRGTALAIPAFALLSTVRRWGVSTLGDLAHLPSADLFERLGVGGLTLQRFARGEDEGPLVPAPVEERFESSLALEWPVEGLEPLSFVLSRVFDQLCARLKRAGVGAAVIHVRLKLVTREIHTRTLQLPTPLHDSRVLRALVLLDLESHPPSAGIDQVTVVVDPVPARTQQFSLLESARPSPERASILVARLTALVGEGRCGSPALVDSHDTAGFEMRSFDNNTIRSAPSTTTRSTPLLRQKHGPLGSGQVRTGQDDRETPKRKPRLGSDNVRETPVDGDWRQVMRACPQETGRRQETGEAGLPAEAVVKAGGLRRILQQSASRFSGRAPLCPMLRRFRVPVAARVRVRKGRPVRVTAPRMPGGEVVHWSGPWRTSGQWWIDAPRPQVRGESPASHRDPSETTPRSVSARRDEGAYRQYSTPVRSGSTLAVSGCSALRQAQGVPSASRGAGRMQLDALPWDRDEWDVSLTDGGVYRIFHDRRVDRWFLEGMVD